MLTTSFYSYAQEVDNNADTLRQYGPKVYLDCGWWCDDDYVRTEIPLSITSGTERKRRCICLLLHSEREAAVENIRLPLLVSKTLPI